MGQNTLKQDVIVIFGCACCLVQCALCLILLIAQWIRHPTCILYLKIQLCSAVVSQMCMFLYAAKNVISYYFFFHFLTQTTEDIISFKCPIYFILGVFSYIFPFFFQNDYGYFSLCLQIVTIVEITSHLSQLLIVYTEIISFPQFTNIKLPIIGVATGKTAILFFMILIPR